jgi:hypothetical protein
VIQVAFLRIARVVKWQTRTFEGRMPKGVGVQVPPRAGGGHLSPRAEVLTTGLSPS